MNDSRLRLLNDKPSSLKKDQLNYKSIVKKLSERIVSSLHSTPFTLGILAPWGQGKTSMMKMLKSELLSEDQEFVCVWFQPWKYHNREEVWKGLSLKLISELSPNETIGSQIVTNKNTIIEFIAKKLWKNTLGINIDSFIDKLAKTPWSPSLLHEFEKNFDEIIKVMDRQNNSKPIIIFVDDIDRCVPETAAAVFEALKLVLERHGIITIIALADKELMSLLNNRFSPEKSVQKSWAGEYIQKIIHIPFRIPSISNEYFKNYVIACMKESGIVNHISDVQSWSTLISIISEFNLRAVKVIINGIVTEWDKITSNPCLVGNKKEDLQFSRAAFIYLLGKVSPDIYSEIVEGNDYGLYLVYQDYFLSSFPIIDEKLNLLSASDEKLQSLFKLTFQPKHEKPLIEKFSSRKELEPYFGYFIADTAVNNQEATNSSRIVWKDKTDISIFVSYTLIRANTELENLDFGPYTLKIKQLTSEAADLGNYREFLSLQEFQTNVCETADDKMVMLEKYSELVTIAQKAQDFATCVTNLIKIGRVWVEIGKTEQANDYFNKAKYLCQKHRLDNKLLVESLLEIAQCRIIENRLDDAGQAIALAESISEKDNLEEQIKLSIEKKIDISTSGKQIVEEKVFSPLIEFWKDRGNFEIAARIQSKKCIAFNTNPDMLVSSLIDQDASLRARVSSYSRAGYLFLNSDKVDSAFFFLKKAAHLIPSSTIKLNFCLNLLSFCKSVPTSKSAVLNELSSLAIFEDSASESSFRAALANVFLGMKDFVCATREHDLAIKKLMFNKPNTDSNELVKLINSHETHIINIKKMS
ncbi:P-loop NTPase fold protein [uncultured Alteromonas sp.]|jgi:tetratricopeptide (TPR) repeat protein|uniref:KAP family P-loop NTPase fold protein n=1 Tax=uncultured Alteromonas sp. TaxID=179113 RepID=UPI0025830232|nr:P-loop NTPase fold protein [uncultured Alteromonas sp.]|tara:strand:- start:2298 stop:4733 length:2436 start_codon:yes stop_codon:yes gene_type:complete